MKPSSDFLAYADALNPPSGALDAERMLKQAREATGLEQWGSNRAEIDRFRHRFGVLCRSLNQDASSASRDIDTAAELAAIQGVQARF